MAKANLKKVTRQENKKRKKNAMADAAQKAADAGKGSAKRLTGYFTTKGSETNNMVKPREARPYARAEKKDAKKSVRLAAYRSVASEKLASKKLAEAKSSDKRSGTSKDSYLSDTKQTQSKNSYRTMSASANKDRAKSRAAGAGMSDKKISKVATKATKAAVKRSK